MDNHVHYIVFIPDEYVPEFMQYLNGNMARALNRLLGRNHQFWSRRYSAEPILDADAELDRLVYLLCNPSSANLVS